MTMDEPSNQLSGNSGTLPPLPEPAAHMYPSDLERFQTNETFATAYSVAVGNPDERSVPLMTLSDTVAYAAAAVAMERERCAKVCERVNDSTGECPELALHCAAAIRGA